MSAEETQRSAGRRVDDEKDMVNVNYTVSTYSGRAGDWTESNQTTIAHTPVVCDHDNT
jgi:hypothetical protein